VQIVDRRDGLMTGTLMRFMSTVERVGNKLPHPFWLFGILSLVLAAASALLAAFTVSVAMPGSGDTVAVRSLASSDGITMALSTAVENFVTFPPLGNALVIMIGVAVADKAGLLSTALRAAVLRVPPKMVTFGLAFTAMIAHVASDAAYIVLIPLGAIVYRAVGRSPILGIVVAFVSISAGTDASPLITPTDVILSGLTTAAAHTIDSAVTVGPVANYYFSLASSVVLALIITLVVELFIAKRVEQDGYDLPAETEDEINARGLTADQRRGLRNSAVCTAILLMLIGLALLPSGSPLRGEGGALLESPVVSEIAVVLSLMFAVTGAAYGMAVGTVRTSRDIPELITAGLRDIAPIVMLFFAVSQFLAYFRWTHIGEVIAVQGAGLLKAADAHTLVIAAGLLILVSLINLIITSGSAMWSLIAPIFVPMLMLLDIPPQTTQALYRIADSCSNVVTPMGVYFILALGFVQQYRKNAGIGTLAAMTAPIAMAMFLGWVLLFVMWWILGIPLGPGYPVR